MILKNIDYINYKIVLNQLSKKVLKIKISKEKLINNWFAYGFGGAATPTSEAEYSINKNKILAQAIMRF